MIKVTCQACSRSFQARDELAGRKGKCPSCGEPLVVPGGSAPAPAPAAGPAARPASAPRPSAPRAPSVQAPSASSSRRTAGASRARTHRGGARGGGGGQLNRLLGLVGLVVLLGAGAFYVIGGGGDPVTVNPYTAGLDALGRGRYQEAIAFFEQVPSTASTYPQAQEKLVAAREQLAAGSSVADAKRADLIYNIIKRIEKDVEREGPTGANYATTARYMLKRCAEFVAEHGDDSRAGEIGQYAFVWSNVASLDEPPTYGDVDTELTYRLFGKAPTFAECMQAIDEFAKAGGSSAQVAQLRDRVQAYVLTNWQRVHDELEAGNDLTPGAENWQRVANQTAGFIQRIEAVPGLEVPAEARALLARAESGGG